jgi:hypothetical protein
MEVVEPILANLLIDNELPNEKASSNDNPLPKRIEPYTLNDEPILTNDLTLIALPTHTKSKAESDEPSLVNP